MAALRKKVEYIKDHTGVGWEVGSQAGNLDWTPARERKLRWPDIDKLIRRSHVSPALEAALVDASKLPEMGADWDDDGAEAIAAETVQRAASMLRVVARQLGLNYTELPVPRISPCPDGSLDLYWKGDDYQLLINVKPGKAECDYFGERSNGRVTKGPFMPEDIEVSMFSWLLG